jgi:putative lipoprotein
VPLPFRLAYDPARIIDSHTYQVRASLYLEDRLLFTTDTAHRVITAGSPSDLMILMVQVAARDAEQHPG